MAGRPLAMGPLHGEDVGSLEHLLLTCDLIMSHEARLAVLGVALPEPPVAAGMYATVVPVGDMLYLAGHIPTDARGKVGADVGEQQAHAAAAAVGYLVVATLRHHLGSLDRVERIVKVTGLVNCAPEFVNIPQVINGFSQVMLDVFGEAGRAARSAIGAVSLPLGVPVEVEAIVQVRATPPLGMRSDEAAATGGASLTLSPTPVELEL